MREDVLVPAGMRTATSDRVERRRTRNRAWPHARRDGPMHGMGTQKAIDDSGQRRVRSRAGRQRRARRAASRPAPTTWAAGSQSSSRAARSRRAGRLFSEAASREMWTPRVHVPISASAGPRRRGHAAVQQLRAGLDGARLSRPSADHAHRRRVRRAGDHRCSIPERNVGFSVAINCEDGEAALGVAYELLDHYLERPRYDWARGLAGGRAPARRAGGGASCKQQTSTPARVGPSLPLERYAGAFADAWYGPDRHRAPGWPADHGLQADARHDGRADALAIRHVPRRLARLADRAGLRDVRAQGGRRRSTASACAPSRRWRTSASTTRTWT